MPVVPASPVPTVAPAATTGIQYQSTSASPAAFGYEVGQAEQGLAGGIEKFGDVLAKHAIKMQEDVNTTQANNMFVAAGILAGQETEKLKQSQGLNTPGVYDEYVKNLEKIRNDALAAAPNDDVKKRFDQEFRRRIGYSVEDGARYVGQQLKAAKNASSAAVRASNLSTIAQNANDDARFNAETEKGIQSLQDDDFKGSTPEAQENIKRTFVTAAWATRLESMAKNEPLRARELLKNNKEKLDGGKVLQLETAINQQIINVDTRESSDKIIQSGALVDPALKESIKKFEGYSAGAKWDYKQNSSGYGTKAQPGDENIPKDQLKAIHEQRLDNELARAANIVDNFYPGLPSGTRNALISLTYNAGSAWTSAGLGQSLRAGDFDKAREKLGEYVKAGGVDNDGLIKRRAQEASWWGGEPHESDPTTQLTTAMDKAKERAIQVFPDDPGNQARYLDALQSRIRSDQSVMQTAARQIQLDMRNIVQKELVNDQSVTTYDRLSPQAKQAYDQSPPSQQDVFNRQMRKNATADVPLTPERQNLYDSIHGEAVTPSTREKFLSRNLSELDLPRAQKSKLIALQDNAKALVERGIRSSNIIKDSQAFLNDAGIRDSQTDTAARGEFVRFKGVLDQQVQQFLDEKKRPPTPEEGRAMVHQLTREVVTSSGLIWDTKQRDYQTKPAKVYSVEEAKALPSGTPFILNGEPRIRE